MLNDKCFLGGLCFRLRALRLRRDVWVLESFVRIMGSESFFGGGHY